MSGPGAGRAVRPGPASAAPTSAASTSPAASTSAPGPPRPAIRELTRDGDFRWLWATRLVSQTGDGAFQAALGAYVFFNPNNATTARSAAAAFAAVLLPYSLVGPFAGVLLDRWSRQRVLVVAGVVRALLVAGVAALAVAGRAGPAFFALALLVVSANRFVLAALPAALPRVVPRAGLVLANSATTTSGTIVAVAGGGLGVAATTALGGGDRASGGALLAAVALYLASAVVASQLDRARLGPDPDAGRPSARAAVVAVFAAIRAGAGHVWARRPAAYALSAIAAHRFFYGVSFVATLLLYRNYFPVQEGGSADVLAGIGGLALVFAMSAVGFLLGAVVTPRVTRRIAKSRWIVWLFSGAAVAEVVLGTPYQQGPFLVAALLLGFVAQASKICVDTIVQETVDDAFRGRVFSFYDVVFNVSFVLASVFAAFSLPSTGKSYAVLAVIAVGYAATAGWYAVVSRRP